MSLLKLLTSQRPRPTSSAPRRRPIRSSERGAEIVEFALTFPMAMVVMTGILVFGLYINKQLALQSATDEAAQITSITRGTGVASNPCAEFVSVFETVAPNLNPASLTFTYTINGAGFTGTTCSSAASDIVQGAAFKVTTTYPCALAVFGKNFVPGCTLYSTTTEIIE
jgi:Flp pilus assembly protein TadG